MQKNKYIANSRVGDDNGIGEKTCKDKSVVDYLLLSSQLFPLIKQFKIEDFIPLYSDCHSFTTIFLPVPRGSSKLR